MKQYTSDQHINDTYINKFHPERFDIFGSNKIMTKNIIHKQNMQVHENDIVYVLGDFIMGKKLDDVIKILNKLNGRIHLILGNHDTLLSNKNISLPNKVVVHNDIVQTKLYNGQKLYLYHYPLFEWPDYYEPNTYHLYGHLHGKRSHPDRRALEVSCNLYNYMLLSENKIIELLNKKAYN